MRLSESPKAYIFVTKSAAVRNGIPRSALTMMLVSRITRIVTLPIHGSFAQFLLLKVLVEQFLIVFFFQHLICGIFLTFCEGSQPKLNERRKAFFVPRIQICHQLRKGIGHFQDNIFHKPNIRNYARISGWLNAPPTSSCPRPLLRPSAPPTARRCASIR